MITKIKNKINREFEKIQFKIFSNLLKKYDVEFFYKDKMGILTKRKFDDNFQYIFKTKNSCDAVPLMEALNERIKGSKICIDIGANIGITTIWMARNSEKVYSFEPETNNIFRFKENLYANNVENVKLIQKAVSDIIGELDLNILESYGHHSLGQVATSKIIGRQKVDVITLNKFCLENNIDKIDFLKVDVEGFEIEVFNGAKNLFMNKKIKLVAFEISDIPLKSLNKSEKEIFDFFKSVNYDILNLDGSFFNTNSYEKISHLDLIAIPKV
jgi:FkbM family methyltransferase